MSKPTDIGLNRTGMGTSPLLSKQMRDSSGQLPVYAADGPLKAMQVDYQREASPIGTVPPPSKLKGMAKTAVQLLKGKKPTVYLDRLGERLGFERTGTRLYDLLLLKHEAKGGYAGGPSRDELERFRAEELEHFELLHQEIEKLGGDPTAVTPSADVAAVASQGVLKICADPRMTLAQGLEGILVAELVDRDGWDTLIALAEGLGQDEAAERFRRALAEEERHLRLVRGWVSGYLEAESELSGPQPRPPA